MNQPFSPNDDEKKETAAYLMQKSMYHEFQGQHKKRRDALIKNLAKLDDVLVRRQARTSLDI